MKSIYFKSILKMIKSHLSRFLAIVAISLLGAMVFVGLSATSINMKKSVQKNIDEHHLYDYRLYSNYGFNEKDLKTFPDYKVEAGIEFSALGKVNNQNYLFKFETLPQIHTIEMIEGRLPENQNEIIINAKPLNKFKVGEEIDFSKQLNTLDQPIFKDTKLKIVGTFKSTQYLINIISGVNLGSGFVENIAYLPISNVKLENYTFMSLYQGKSDAFSKAYLDELHLKKQSVELNANQRANSKFSAFKQGLIDELTKAKEELNTKISEGKTKIENAKKLILDKEKTLKNGLSEYNQNRKKLEENEKLYEDALKQFESKKNNALTMFDENKAKALAPIDFQIEQNPQLKVQLETQKQAILNQFSEQYDAMQNEFKQAQNQLNIQKQQLEDSKIKLTQALNQLNAAQEKIDEGKAEIARNQETLNEKEKEGLAKIEEGQSKIDDLKKEEWIVTSRLENQGFLQAKTRAESVEKLSSVFPIVFFGVAVFVVSMSLTRMVDEERIIIGTLKSLGYSKTLIQFRYLIYVLLATILGALIGCALGFYVITNLVYDAVSQILNLPKMVYVVSLELVVLTILIMIGCAGITTLLTLRKVLKENTAALLLQRSDMKGKPILLQRIKFIWKKLTFMQKVTTRNLFFNKKRFILTIIGVAGCVVLMVSGLGLKESVNQVAKLQYSKIHQYETKIQFNELNDTLKEVANTHQGYFVYGNVYKLDNEAIQLLAMDETSFKTLIQSNQSLNDVIISSNLARLKNYKVNDKIELVDYTTKEKVTYTINGISDNYLGYFIYVNSKLIENKPNTLYLTQKLDQVTQFKLENDDQVKSIVVTDDLIKNLRNVTGSIDFAIYILIIFSGILMFIVIYNLTNISISERIRELATIKVLGFYDKEVNKYIFREVIILSVIGAIIGLIAAPFVFEIVIQSIEEPLTIFPRILSIQNYIISFVLAMFYTLIVNFVMSKIIKKVDMLSALKSIE